MLILLAWDEFLNAGFIARKNFQNEIPEERGLTVIPSVKQFEFEEPSFNSRIKEETLHGLGLYWLAASIIFMLSKQKKNAHNSTAKDRWTYGGERCE